ncbi:MAG: rod shape-determining protein RodA [Planctomycetota bacterium]|nr:MAG: rod shape-determining protein RodA [Planctomycetota bacterium]
MSGPVGRFLPPLGWPILLAALALTGLGLACVYSAEMTSDAPATQTLRQAAYLGVGLVSLVVIQALGYRWFGRWSYFLFGVTLVLLVLLLVARYVPMAPLIRARRNTYRWIDIGPLSFQVSEYAKVVFILALAYYLRFRTNYRTLRGLLAPFVLTLVPLGLILKEPDLGTSLLLLPSLFVMLYVAGAKNRHLLSIIALGLVAAPIFYHSPLMNEYQRDRIRALWQQDEADEKWRLNAGYQLNQSKIALGSGGALGEGFEHAAFFKYNLLPEEHNDFIFAVIGHQWGFAGCLFVLACYLLIIACGLTIASMTTDPLGRLLAVGVCVLIAAQAIINIGMTVGLMPITGMTLPFVSMGGSGLVANYIAIGLLIDVGRRRPIDIARKPFEFFDDEE